MEFSRQEFWSGCHFFLQGIFPTQGSNPRLLHWQVNSSALCHLGSPGILSLPCKPHILPSCSFRVQAAGLRDTLPGSAPPPIGARALGAERQGQASVTPAPREPLGAGGRGLGRERGPGLGWLGPQAGSVPGLRGSARKGGLDPGLEVGIE